MGKFLKDILASAIGTIVGISVAVTFGSLALMGVIVASFSHDAEPMVKDKSLLVINLSTPIQDSPVPFNLDMLLSNQYQNILSLRQVLTAIEDGTTDENISGIFLTSNGGDNGNGYGSLKEIRAALIKFQQASGKPIVAYGDNWNERNYYLTSVADEVYLNPLGGIEMNGFSSEPLFLKGALDKFGVGMQVVRVGTFKGAVEPYLREDLSPENREQTQTLLDDIWRDYRTTVAAERETVTPEQLQTIANTQAYLNAEQSKTAGLVDEIKYFDEVLTRLREITGTDSPDKEIPQVSVSEYLQLNQPLSFEEGNSSEPTIAVVYAEGTIVPGNGEINQAGGDRLAKALRAVRQDENVEAVVLRVNSPGGSVTASEIIWREVSLIAQTKPIVVSMGDMAASGGYWIAMGANHIFAEKSTITGSIGVFGLLPHFESVANNNGLTWDTVKTSQLADLDTITRPKTAPELAIYQQEVNRMYNLFLDRVAKARNLPVEKVGTLAQGRVWSGEDAKANGLVDQIGGLDDAIAYVAQQANLSGDWAIKEYPEPRTIEDELIDLFGEAQLKQNPAIAAEWRKFQQNLSVLTSLNDPKGIYSRLPLTLTMD